MLALNEADWAWIGAHFNLRMKRRQMLVQYHREGSQLKFAELALGVSDPLGNVSASAFGLGPLILDGNHNAVNRIFELGGRMLAMTAAVELPQLVAQANLYSFKIGVGSELACMLRPSLCWVANTKTFWNYLVDDCEGDEKQASVLIGSYNEVGIATIYPHMESSMLRAAERQPNVDSPALAGVRAYRFLWGAAVCTRAYERNFSA